MKIFSIVTLMTLLVTPSFAQYLSSEKQIRQKELGWTALLNKNDKLGLKKKFIDDYLLDNAQGKTVFTAEILSLLRDRERFPKIERNIEQMTFRGNLVAVNGVEIEYVKDKVRKRCRFTNVWMLTNQGWKLVARQTNGH